MESPPPASCPRLLITAGCIGTPADLYDDPDVIAKVSPEPRKAMGGINAEEIPQPHHLAERGW